MRIELVAMVRSMRVVVPQKTILIEGGILRVDKCHGIPSPQPVLPLKVDARAGNDQSAAA
jgi:hypothetical protein